MKSEIRQNKATKRWVIYAPARRKRPKEFKERKEEEKALPERDRTCPFCPGNEDMLPGIVMSLPGSGSDDWQTRVVPNKFPALQYDGKTREDIGGVYLAMPGQGRHEVIVENPRHDEDLTTMSTEEVEVVMETYHRRYVELMREHDNMMAIIFRNRGPKSGASMLHPHSQLVVTGVVPRYIRWREQEAQRYFDDWGRCVFCDILKFETKEQERVLLENDSFLAFIPFAAEVPFEIWIMPKRHQADFGDISDAEKADLAHVLRHVLRRLRDKLNDPSYNYVINTAAQYKADEPQLHWYFQIRPRLTTEAGFEVGSGMRINPSIPEEDAAFLK